MATAQGPLGALRGMRWDSDKQKYFPASAAPPKPPSSAEIARLRGLISRRTGSSSGASPAGGDRGNPAGASSRTETTREGGTRERRSHILFASGEAGGDARIKGHRESGALRVKEEDEHLIGVSSIGGKRRRVMKQPRSRSGLPRIKGRDDVETGLLQQHYEALSLVNLSDHSLCCNDYITSLHPYLNDSYTATTAHGLVISKPSFGEESLMFEACSSGIAGFHRDIARMANIFVSQGPEPHVHMYKRSAEHPDALILESDDVPGTRTKDVFAVSGTDGRLSIASSRAIHSMTYHDEIKWSSRKMPSDPLALHHVDSTLIFAGLRNGSAHLVDLRTPRATPDYIVRSLAGKAIVNVKRLDDATVPWGLAVSAMNDEMLVFDIRYPSLPLHFLEGHHNSAHTDLGWAFSSADRFLFAASVQPNSGTGPGSRYDHTVNAWDLRTGTQINPSRAEPFSKSKEAARIPGHNIGTSQLLDEKFPDRIRAIAVRQGDRGVDVASGWQLYRYGPMNDGGQEREA